MKTKHRIAIIIFLCCMFVSVMPVNPGPYKQVSDKNDDPLNRIFGSSCVIKAQKMTTVTNLQTQELQFMKMEGNVEVKSIKMDMTCEEVVIDMGSQKMMAKSKEHGLLQFRRHKATGTGNRLNYDIMSDTLILDGEPQ